MFKTNYDRSAAERLALTIPSRTAPATPLPIENSDYVVTTDDDDRVLGLDSIEVNGRMFKVGLLK